MEATYEDFLRRATVANSLFGSLQRFSVPGPIFQLIALSVFGLSGLNYSYIAGGFAALALFQVIGLYIQYRSDAYRPLIWSYDIRGGALFMQAAALALFGLAGQTAAAVVFFTGAAIVNICHMVGFNVSWPLIMRTWTTTENRGKTIATLRGVQAAMAAVVALAVSLVGSTGYFRRFLLSLFVVFAIYSIVAARQIVWMQRRGASITRPPQSEAALKSIWRDFKVLSHMSPFRTLAMAVLLAGLSIFPLQVFFLRDVLHLDDKLIYWFVTLLIWLGIASTQLWGYMSDKLGTSRTLNVTSLTNVVSFLIILVTLIGWAFLGRLSILSTSTIAVCILVSGIAFQGFNIGWYSAALEVIPKECTSLGILILSVLIEIAASGGAFLVGAAREWVTVAPAIREVAIAAVLLCIAIAAYSAMTIWMRARQHVGQPV